MRKRTLLRAALATGLVATLAAAPDLTNRSQPAQAATLTEDADRNSPVGTGWNYYYGQSAANLSALAGSGKRIINVEVSSMSGDTPLFDAIMVTNTGDFARTGPALSVGLTSTTLASTLGSTKRLVDLERYSTSAGIRYAASYIDNTGDAQKTWGYFLGSTAGQVSTILGSTRRLVDLGGYTSGSGTFFHGIWVDNVGADMRTSKHYLGISPATLSTALASGGTSAGHRVLVLERRGSVFDVVTVAPRAGERWYYYYGQSATSVANLVSQLGTRLYSLKRTSAGTFDVLMVNNLAGESLRVRNLVASGHAASNNWGFYVKRVGGSTVAGLQPDRQFEPASAIKVLQHLAFHRQDAGSSSINLGTRMDWYKNPDRSAENAGDGPNTCPDYAETSTTAVRASARQVDYGMMWDSDNRHTRAMTLRFGLANLNSLAATLGMSKTKVNQARIGCGWDGGVRNYLTLRDAGTLYEKVRNGSALSASFRPQFEDLMINGPAGFLNTIVDEEAASLGTVSADEKAAFKAATRYIGKGGSYNICLTSTCSTAFFTRTEAGMVTLPAKAVDGTVVPTDYVFGRYFEGQCTSSCSAISTIQTANDKARVEMFRSAIRSALTNW